MIRGWPLWPEKWSGIGATIIEADAQTIDWDELLADVTGPAHVVANLPYNVGTTMIIDILADVPKVGAMLVLVQAEVADRLTADVGSRTYGIPTVLVARHANAEIVGHVPPTVFVPKPKVDSSLVRLTRHSSPPSTVAHERSGPRRESWLWAATQDAAPLTRWCRCSGTAHRGRDRSDAAS